VLLGGAGAGDDGGAGGGAVRAGGVEVLPGEAARRRRQSPLPRVVLPLQGEHRLQPRRLHVQVRRQSFRRFLPSVP